MGKYRAICWRVHQATDLGCLNFHLLCYIPTLCFLIASHEKAWDSWDQCWSASIQVEQSLLDPSLGVLWWCGVCHCVGFQHFFVVDVVTQRVFVLIFFPQLKWQRSLSKTKRGYNVWNTFPFNDLQHSQLGQSWLWCQIAGALTPLSISLTKQNSKASSSSKHLSRNDSPTVSATGTDPSALPPSLLTFIKH